MPALPKLATCFLMIIRHLVCLPIVSTGLVEEFHRSRADNITRLFSIGRRTPPRGPKASAETQIYATGFPSVSTMLSPVWSCKASSSSIGIYIGFLPPVCLLVVVQCLGSNDPLAGFPILGPFLFMSLYTYRMFVDRPSFQ